MPDNLDQTTETTLSNLAQISGLQHPQLRRAAIDGRLQARKAGNTWLSTLAAIQQALAAGHLQRRRGRPSK